jgi:hypothetical protein
VVFAGLSTVTHLISLENKVKHVKLSRYRHVGAKVERSYSSYSFLSSVLDGDGQRHAPAELYHPERIPVPILQEAGWASELV